MRLTKIHITNFRSVEDSTEFDIGQVLALVGKNEAGKTAILQALAGLNPHSLTPVIYNIERDYPRRLLTEYADKYPDPKNGAKVVSTKWTMTDAEKNTIQTEIGDALLDKPVVIYRRFSDTEPEWELPIDYKKAAQNLMAAEHLDDEEMAPLSDAESTSKLREKLEKIAEPTARQNRLLERLTAYPEKCVKGFAEATLAKGFPYFMYSSHYDRMVGEIRLDTFEARRQRQNPAFQSQGEIKSGEQVFVDFLEYAGTTLNEIRTANTYESLNARCEAASSHITAQLLEYWTQNPNIEFEIRVTKAEAGDPFPFNEGIVARARVKNNLHKLSLPFSERSAGFVWFFSFLVKFAQVQRTAGDLILLLDEPGLTLHGKAQGDLLRYFDEKLAPKHQVIYSTHSPFMVPADNLPAVRIVEDRILQPKPGQWTSEGTKVRDDTLATDRDTLFPLQGALGYEITQTLFVGKHTCLIEGPGDILFIEAWSSALGRRNRTVLDRRWTLCPAGGIDKIQPFVSLFSGQKLDIAALSDYAKGDKKKIDSLRQNKLLEGNRMLTFATILGLQEADVEDVFAPALYAEIINSAFQLPESNQATAQSLTDANQNTTRLVKKAEAFFAVLPPGLPEFNHFTPANWLFLNPQVLDRNNADVNSTLERAEQVIIALNKLL
jgi:energy-coupling factor transporter ATP-binding protein EcfA2